MAGIQSGIWCRLNLNSSDFSNDMFSVTISWKIKRIWYSRLFLWPQHECVVLRWHTKCEYVHSWLNRCHNQMEFVWISKDGFIALKSNQKKFTLRFVDVDFSLFFLIKTFSFRESNRNHNIQFQIASVNNCELGNSFCLFRFLVRIFRNNNLSTLVWCTSFPRILKIGLNVKANCWPLIKKFILMNPSIALHFLSSSPLSIAYGSVNVMLLLFLCASYFFQFNFPTLHTNAHDNDPLTQLSCTNSRVSGS